MPCPLSLFWTGIWPSRAIFLVIYRFNAEKGPRGPVNPPEQAQGAREQLISRKVTLFRPKGAEKEVT